MLYLHCSMYNRLHTPPPASSQNLRATPSRNFFIFYFSWGVCSVCLFLGQRTRRVMLLGCVMGLATEGCEDG